LVVTNPVNSTVPIVAEVLKHHGVYDPRRLFGVTSLDVVRASTFISDIKASVDPATLRVTVVGGHSGATIVPLLSQTGLQFSEDELKSLTNRIQFGGDEVVKAKDGAGSATLSMAFAGARFTNAILEAASGKSGVVEPTFVKSDLYASEGVDFFASNVELGRDGVVKIHPVGTLSAYEKELLAVCLADLKKNIQKGYEFAKTKTANL
jgi:malate dehydrogenase